MSFLAPWAMAFGALAAAGAVLLHLVARHQPSAFLFPTARFIPDRQTLVSRAASRPRDLLLLAVRVLLLLCAGAAFARPVFVATRAPRARVVLVDRSSIVADAGAAMARARVLATGMPTTVIAFDTVAATLALADSSGTVPRVAGGSLTAALVAARRAAAPLAERADSVELVILSPVAAAELDDATLVVRAAWPGAIRLERLAMRDAVAETPMLERAVPVTDVLGPALVRMAVGTGAHAVRIRRAPRAAVGDSAWARAGGTLVLWDTTGAAPLHAEGLAAGDDVIVAPLGRIASGGHGATVARWADGSAAAREIGVGDGCIRRVGIALPASGDLALRPGFQRMVRALVAPCSGRTPNAPADSATIRRLAGGGPLASARALGTDDDAPSRLAPWLLGVALACALLEIVLRRRPSSSEAG